MTVRAVQEQSAYDVESYWSRVARQIAARERGNVVAGDDDPFWRYKREKFLATFLHTIDFSGVKALEIGCGPGGNLIEVARRQAPASLSAVDISQTMIDLARSNLARHGVTAELQKVDGAHLPFRNGAVDLTYTVTVLQHNTDDGAFEQLCGELCRVTRDRIVLMEDTGNGMRSPSGSFVARPIERYRDVLSLHGFKLTSADRLHVQASGFAHAVIHRLLVRKDRKEGDPIGRLPQSLLSTMLAGTRLLDRVVPESIGLTKMVFQRTPAS